MAVIDKIEIDHLLRTPQEVMLDCAKRLRAIRLENNITQTTLAKRAGIAEGTIKRFEHTGEIQFNHLLRIALVLGRLDEVDQLFPITVKPESLFNLKEPQKRQRARGKQ